MNLKIYSVLDAVVGAYLQPFFCRSEGEAIRMVKAAVNDPKSQFNKNAADFALAYHGEYDDNSGDFITQPAQRLLVLSSLIEDTARSPFADLMAKPADPESRN